MRQKHWNLYIMGIASLLSLLFYSSCEADQNEHDLAIRMAKLDGEVENDARIQELKKEIRAVQSSVEKTIQAVQKKSTYWRLLGLKYMDYQMWGEASNAFNEALQITPEYASLSYNRGLCLGQLALIQVDAEKARILIEQAEFHHRRALDIDPRYTPAMYALAVILVFEKKEAVEAARLLENVLQIERSDKKAHFLLARAYLENGKIVDALQIYDEIKHDESNPEAQSRASELYQQVAEDHNES